MRRKHIAMALAGAALTAALAYFYLGHTVPSGQPPLRNLTGAAQFAQTFNAANDEVRVVLLLSPT
jgi:hypothetical protein